MLKMNSLLPSCNVCIHSLLLSSSSKHLSYFLSNPYCTNLSAAWIAIPWQLSLFELELCIFPWTFVAASTMDRLVLLGPPIRCRQWWEKVLSRTTLCSVQSAWRQQLIEEITHAHGAEGAINSMEIGSGEGAGPPEQSRGAKWMTTNSMMTSDGQIRLTGSMTQKNGGTLWHVLHTNRYQFYYVCPAVVAAFMGFFHSNCGRQGRVLSFLPSLQSGNFNYYFQLSKMAVRLFFSSVFALYLCSTSCICICIRIHISVCN